jgi:hypothetical protein
MNQLNPPIIELDLPLAPATNNLYFIRRGRKVLSDAGREYKAQVARILSNGFTHEFIPPKTNLCFAATFNCLKCTIDSIFQGFKAMGGDVNDNRITEIHTVKKLALKEDLTGCCTVEISLANEAINA